MWRRAAKPICRRLEKHAELWALSLALDNAGSSIAARMAMMAMTTNSSMRVKAWLRFLFRPFIEISVHLTAQPLGSTRRAYHCFCAKQADSDAHRARASRNVRGYPAFSPILSLEE